MSERLSTVQKRRPRPQPAPEAAAEPAPDPVGTARLWDQKGNLIASFHVDEPILVTVEGANGRLTGRLSIESKANVR